MSGKRRWFSLMGTLPLIEAYDRSTNPSAVQYSGYSVSEHERPLPTMLPSFPVELESDRSSIQYFKIASPYEISLSYEVKALNQAFTDSGLFETLRYALALGLFVLLAYNVATALIVRQGLHWFYVAFVGLMLCTQLLDLNVFVPYITVDFTVFTVLPSYVSGMIFLALLLSHMSSRWFRWGLTGFCLSCVSTTIVFDISDAYQVMLDVLIPLGLIILSAQVITGVIQQKPYCKLVFVGWGYFISGTVIALMAIGGTLPAEYMSAYAVGLTRIHS